MNKVILIGRLTRDPEVRYSQGENRTVIARYTLAIDRKYKRDGEQTADFINCVAIGRNGDFAEKYLHQGIKIAVCGRIQTGSYTNKEGHKVYTTDIVVEEHDFCERKADNGTAMQYGTQGGFPNYGRAGSDGFQNIPDGIDEELPFN